MDAKPTPSLPPSSSTDRAPVASGSSKPSAAPGAKRSVDQIQHRRRKVLIIIAAALVVLIIAVAYISMAVANEPKRVGTDFLKDLQANKTQAAYGLTSSAFRKATSETALNQLFGHISPQLQGKSSLSDHKLRKMDGAEEAIIVYTIKTAHGDRYVRVVLTDSTRDWQVLNFRASATRLDTSSDR